MHAPAERPSRRWGDLGLRIASAAVLGPLALAGVWFGGWIFRVLVIVVALGLAIEWLMLCRQPAVRRGGMRLRAAGLAYVALAAAAVVWLRSDPAAGRANVVFLVLIVWAGDIAAYLVGRLVGGPRLAPMVSPGKTWSGALGGLLGSIAVGLVAAYFLASSVSVWRAVPLAACLGVVAQAGDLLESFVKRRLEVKDSSHLIPGHGGLFDRLDGVLAVAPIAALLALTLGRGVVLWQ